MFNPKPNTPGQIVCNGTTYPVTAAVNAYPDGWTLETEEEALFKAKVGEALTEPEEALIKAWLHRIYAANHHAGKEAEAVEAWRANQRLNHEQRSYLTAWTNRQNIANAVRVLGADAHKLHGFEGVDQLHGNTHAHPCGCEIHVVFDHHQRHALKPEHIRPHRIERQCRGHAQHKDVQGLHAALMVDTAAKPVPERG